MSLFKQTSIPYWVSTIKTDPILAIVAGFQPGKTACVGTYYNLFQKLENGPYRPKCCHRVLASDLRKARSHFRFPKEKPKDEEKNKPVERDVLQKLVEQLCREADEPIPNDVEKLMNEILCEVALKPSAAKGLLGDITKLVVCSDGSTVPSGASPHGKNTCDCHKKGIYRCEHLRKYSDIDSDWGWDNREKDWVFGNRYYQFVCCEKKHDLPIYLSMGAASSHEAVMSLKDLERLRKQTETIFPEMKLRYLSGDSIHDAYAYYGYLISHEILYAIPYANQPPKCIDVNGNGILFNEMGVPLCRGGLPMRRITMHRCRHHVYGCPIKRPTHRSEEKNMRLIHREECPREALCEPDSKWGPYVSVKPKDDPRIHPMIPRDSEEYRKLRDLRTGCERSNAMKKITFKLKETKSRVQVYTFIRAVLISILEHSRVWVQQMLEHREITKENVLELFV